MMVQNRNEAGDRYGTYPSAESDRLLESNRSKATVDAGIDKLEHPLQLALVSSSLKQFVGILSCHPENSCFK